MTQHTFNSLTATPQETIARSATMHPSVLQEALMAMSDTHKQAAASMMSPESKDIALKLAADCRRAAYAVEDYPPETAAVVIMQNGMGAWTSALIAACRLLCITPLLRADIVARGPTA